MKILSYYFPIEFYHKTRRYFAHVERIKLKAIFYRINVTHPVNVNSDSPIILLGNTYTGKLDLFATIQEQSLVKKMVNAIKAYCKKQHINLT